MIALHALALLAVLAVPGQPVLLDFHAPWCGPCRSMEPTIRRLAADGYAVRMVNVDEESSLAQQFRVDSVPTYVLVLDGREVGRLVGPTSHAQLAGMFAAARPVAPATPTPQPVAARQDAAPPPAVQAVGAEDPQARAMAATVRLCIEDAGGRSFGTGTIIDVHGSEALVMTCGHLFRESRGQGPMSVDVFPAGAQNPVSGQVLDVLTCDLEQDVALVAIRANCPLTLAPVAPPGYQPRPGDRVFSVGCDQGAAPSLRDSRITALNKYTGPPNIESSGQPVIGRSGGGLFSADGMLIGVCNLADPQDDEGIYAALSLLHTNLDKIAQSQVYQRNAPPTALAQATPSLTPPAMPPAMPPRMPSAPRTNSPLAGVTLSDTTPAALLTSTAQAGLAAALNAEEDTEVICIVRSKSNPRARSQMFYLDRPSQTLLNCLTQESQPQPQPQPQPAGEPVMLQASRDVVPPSRANGTNAIPVVRGQSR